MLTQMVSNMPYLSSFVCIVMANNVHFFFEQQRKGLKELEKMNERLFFAALQSFQFTLIITKATKTPSHSSCNEPTES